MDEMEAMQEDGDNWNQEEMVDATTGAIALDRDLQSSGAGTSSSPPDSESHRPLSARLLDPEKYRYRSATKRFIALKFEEQCFHFKEYLRSPDTFRTYPYFIVHKWDKQNFRKKVEHFTWNEHRQKLFHAYNDQFNYGKYNFSHIVINIPIHTLDANFIFAECMTEKT